MKENLTTYLAKMTPAAQGKFVNRCFSLTEDQSKWIDDTAENRGFSKSAFLRSLLGYAKEALEGDDAARQDVKP